MPATAIPPADLTPVNGGSSAIAPANLSPVNAPAAEIPPADLSPVAGAATEIPAADLSPVAGAALEIPPADLSPVADGAVAITTTPAASLPSMPSTFVPAFAELTGVAGALDTLPANSTDLGKVIQGTVAGQLASYRVAFGTDATDLPGICRVANYADPANRLVFVQC